MAIKSAATKLANGELVVFPTETVYGLGASVRQPAAIRKIYAIKKRPHHQPLILHVLDSQALGAFTNAAPQWAYALAKKFWPGPLTLVLPRASIVPDETTGGGDTVGLRAPDHPVTIELLHAVGLAEAAVPAICAPSANLHGATSPTSLGDLDERLIAQVAQVLDGGDCSVGIESTVVDCCSEYPGIFRFGAISAEEIGEALAPFGLSLDAEQARELPNQSAQLSPERPQRHEKEIAATVRLFSAATFSQCRSKIAAGDSVIARFPKPEVLADRGADIQWCQLPDDDEGFSRSYYRELAACEASGSTTVWVQRADDHGLGRAINARLERRAARK